VGEADSTAIVGNDIWNFVLGKNFSDNLAKLELSLVRVNAVGHEAALNIIKDTEVLTRLVDGNNILETKWELVVTADLSVNLDVLVTALADLKTFLLGKGVLKSLSEQD